MVTGFVSQTYAKNSYSLIYPRCSIILCHFIYLYLSKRIIMNTPLELEFIELLKRSNLEGLEFHGNDEDRIVGCSYHYNNEHTCRLDFEQDGEMLILIDSMSISLYEFPLYFHLKRGAEERTDIQRVQLNVLGYEGQRSEIRYIVDLSILNEGNIESYLYDIERWKHTHTGLVDLRMSNYKNHDLSDLILFREDGAKIIALDRFGITYTCHVPEVTKELLADHFAMAYTKDLIRNARRMSKWEDGWRSYKQSNGHCLYVREEYLMDIPEEMQTMEYCNHHECSMLINMIVAQLY